MFYSRENFTVSGAIAGSGKRVLPILQDAERTGSFAVSLKVKTPAAGLCFGFGGVPVESGVAFTVKSSAALLYSVVAEKAAAFLAVVCGLVHSVTFKVRRAYKTFRRCTRSAMVSKRVLLSCAGGLRL